jgi:hypothetical protein
MLVPCPRHLRALARHARSTATGTHGTHPFRRCHLRHAPPQQAPHRPVHPAAPRDQGPVRRCRAAKEPQSTRACWPGAASKRTVAAGWRAGQRYYSCLSRPHQGRVGNSTSAIVRILSSGATLPRWQGYSRALPLRWVPAFPPKRCRGRPRPGRSGKRHWRNCAGCAGRARLPPQVAVSGAPPGCSGADVPCQLQCCYTQGPL